MAVMDTIPKITIDQKISFRFFLLFSISRCFCVCFSRSFTISGSILPEFSRLFLGIYCCSFLTIEGEELGLLPRAPNLLLVDQTTNKSNSSGDNFRKVNFTAPSNRSRISCNFCNFLLSVIGESFSSFCISHPSIIGAESTSNPSFSPTLTLSFSYLFFAVISYSIPRVFCGEYLR